MAARDSLAETEKGAFVRKESTFRSWVDENSKYTPEAGRYVLYISWACPWANRAAAGLEEVIELSVVHPTWQRTRPDDPNDAHTGWTFADPSDPPFTSPIGNGSFPPKDVIPDPINNAKFVRDLYDKAADVGGQPASAKFTVPILWDKKTSTIVNNESADLVRIFNSSFDKLAKKDVDLYPEAKRSEIDAVNEWIYPQINNGVYRCGFAQSQEAYEAAFGELFAGLDRVEKILGEQKYLTGDELTEADVRLFMTLIRFDHVYVSYFKTNRNFIHQMPNTSRFVRDLYSIKGISSTINMYHIRTHYQSSHPLLNHWAIVAHGPSYWWEESA